MSEQLYTEALYKFGEIVWAKVKGHPWWPGRVSKIYEKSLETNCRVKKEYEVSFLGENTHSKLTKDKLAKFDQNYKQKFTSKNKQLSASIQSAKRIVSGISTIEQEYQNLAIKQIAQKSDKLLIKSPESEFTQDHLQKKVKVSQNNGQQAKDCASQVDIKLRQALSVYINNQDSCLEESELIDLIDEINKFLMQCKEITLNAKRNDAIIFAFNRQWGALLKQLLQYILENGKTSLLIVEKMNKLQQKLIDLMHYFFDNELDQQPKNLNLLSQITSQTKEFESLDTLSWTATPQKLKSKVSDSNEIFNDENSFHLNKIQNNPTLKLGEIKINNPIQQQQQQISVQNTELRRKVCQHIAQILQTQYNIEKKQSQDLTLSIESKIRRLDETMKENYKDKARTIFKLLKNEQLNSEQIFELGEKNFEINFDNLNQYLQEFNQIASKQNSK